MKIYFISNSFKNKNGWKKLCDKILNLDENILFVEIVLNNRIFIKKNPLYDFPLPYESNEEYIDKSLGMWTERKKLSEYFGKPIHSYTKFEKIGRLTLPIIDDGLIVVLIKETNQEEMLIHKIANELLN